MNLAALDESAPLVTTGAGKVGGTFKTGSAVDAILPLYTFCGSSEFSLFLTPRIKIIEGDQQLTNTVDRRI